ncbi:RNA pseudouridylate synthase domain-containing protein 1 [Echinococcus granulosus]|uniref:Pseudouridine synthase domain containing protein n=1 Tax=Echinococcus granulosus TaxID=6210 RepID=U6J6G2_ECHGR|nr:RNA pseudouridylate synthase domain-containing protein [Echinococcus granulosus]EUB60868.1 RNA pseudouridylate synthase domain-containing protein [Echinococcus granulosus]KAH9283795.1 RNA pseudouridylate synthase domain-containing protein 1 [Echinococcus granulosus]CDS18021.1 Pseudouridine synthase domain containing protein [Echinococcus granulosus]
MNILSIALLRAWVFLMWNAQQLIAYIRGKRSVFIPITDLRIVYCDNGLLVVDKSHELLLNSIHPWQNYVTLQMQLFFALPRLADFTLDHMYRFVHRLDAPTSGLICIAYSPKMAGLAAKAFQNRTTKKLYIAVVWGHVQDSTSLDRARLPRSDYLPTLNINVSHCTEMCTKTGDMEYLVDFAIGDLLFSWPEGRRQKIMVPDWTPNCWRPRSAQTKVTVLKHGFLEGSPASLLLLEPHSGRRHQLRLHCALGLRGHPIAGDLLYGRLYGDGDSVEIIKDHRLPRLMLHAYSLHLELVPKPPRVKGEKKQERVDGAHPQPVELYFESSRDMLQGCHWVDAAVFHSL